MFGHRSDGKLVKTIDPLMKLTPHIMPDRNDAQVMSMYEINCQGMDEYIFKQRKENQLRFTYMHILIAAMVRTVAIHPKLNRFVINRRIYKRNTIQISFVVKKALNDTAEETTIKMTFDGTEDIFKVKEKMDKEIEANTKSTSYNDTDALAKWLTVVPMRFVVGILKFLDKIGMLPKSVLTLSPFHTSVFLTNLKSIKMNYAYHHIYNFGSTSIFVAMGKEKYEPVVLDHEEEKIGSAKIMKAGVVIDERICDGLYYGNSMRDFMKFVANPEKLEVPLEKKVEDQK